MGTEIVKGWVYVMTHRAMPGILKIGYTDRDPTLRARELDGSGHPYPFDVRYEALVNDAQSLERSLHSILAPHREGREWFRLSEADAIRTIRKVAGAKILHEECNLEIEQALAERERTFREAEERQTALDNEQREKEREHELKFQPWREEQIRRANQKFDSEIHTRFPPSNYFAHLFCSFTPVIIGELVLADWLAGRSFWNSSLALQLILLGVPVLLFPFLSMLIARRLAEQGIAKLERSREEEIMRIQTASGRAIVYEALHAYQKEVVQDSIRRKPKGNLVREMTAVGFLGYMVILAMNLGAVAFWRTDLSVRGCLVLSLLIFASFSLIFFRRFCREFYSLAARRKDLQERVWRDSASRINEQVKKASEVIPEAKLWRGWIPDTDSLVKQTSSH